MEQGWETPLTGRRLKKKKSPELEDILSPELEDILQIERCTISNKQPKTLCDEIPDIRDDEKLLQMSGG